MDLKDILWSIFLIILFVGLVTVLIMKIRKEWRKK